MQKHLTDANSPVYRAELKVELALAELCEAVGVDPSVFAGHADAVWQAIKDNIEESRGHKNENH
jgi:hypothetical protein